MCDVHGQGRIVRAVSARVPVQVLRVLLAEDLGRESWYVLVKLTGRRQWSCSVWMLW